MMHDPSLVATCCAVMRSALDSAGFANVPVTVKCRLGVDARDSYDELAAFVRTVAVEGHVKHFIIHARKADLSLSAARNRAVPPLRPDWCVSLASEMPYLQLCAAAISTLSLSNLTPETTPETTKSSPDIQRVFRALLLPKPST